MLVYRNASWQKLAALFFFTCIQNLLHLCAQSTKSLSKRACKGFAIAAAYAKKNVAAGEKVAVVNLSLYNHCCFDKYFFFSYLEV